MREEMRSFIIMMESLHMNGFRSCMMTVRPALMDQAADCHYDRCSAKDGQMPKVSADQRAARLLVDHPINVQPGRGCWREPGACCQHVPHLARVHDECGHVARVLLVPAQPEQGGVGVTCLIDDGAVLFVPDHTHGAGLMVRTSFLSSCSAVLVAEK